MTPAVHLQAGERCPVRVTGPGQNDATIATASKTGTTWHADWDTTSVADGDYTRTSVALDPAGNMGRSTAVNITVHNAP